MMIHHQLLLQKPMLLLLQHIIVTSKIDLNGGPFMFHGIPERQKCAAARACPVKCKFFPAAIDKEDRKV